VRKYLTVIGWGLCDMQKARNTYWDLDNSTCRTQYLFYYAF
jgi:hypothetical protein